jgi:hypothetical protein
MPKTIKILMAMPIAPCIRTLAATAVLLASAGAMAAPYAITYHGTIANSGMPANAPDGAAFTLTLVLDNGASTAASQSWNIGQITCGFWRWSASPNVAVALDMTGGIALGAGSAVTNAAGALTAMFTDVNTGGPLAFADYDTSGLPAGASSIGWYADSSAQPFGITAPWGGSFDDGSGTPAGGVQMATSRWSAPQPFTGACDASAVPPTPPTPLALAAVPTLSPWGLLLLSALLGLAALRRKVLNVFAIYRLPGKR